MSVDESGTLKLFDFHTSPASISSSAWRTVTPHSGRDSVDVGCQLLLGFTFGAFRAVLCTMK